MKTFLNRRLSRQLIVPLVITTLVLLIIGTALGYYAYSLQEEHRAERDLLNEKHEVVLNISNHARQMLIHARGYYAFMLPGERERIYSEYELLQYEIDRFDDLDLTMEEARMIDEIREISTRYYHEYLSVAIQLVDEGNTEDLQAYALGGGNDTVDELIQLTNEYVEANNTDTEAAGDAYIESVSMLLGLCLLFILVIMILLFSLFTFLFTRISNPLKQMTEVSEQLVASTDQSFDLPTTKRLDELGILSRSFSKMVIAIQEKEEALTAQNEELKSQQDELERNRDKLLASLEETEAVQERLLKFNRLNRAISTTVNKQKLLDELVAHFDDIYATDKLLFMLTGEQGFATKGLSKTTAAAFSKTLEDGIIPILDETRKPYRVNRNAKALERGIAEQTVLAQDLYIPVVSSENQLVAVFAATRVGQPFQQEEIDELFAAMNQISLAIEKANLYGETERNRQLNQDIIDHVNEAIQFVNQDGKLTQYNQAFKDIVKINDDGNKGTSLEGWTHQFSTAVEEAEQLRDFFNYVIQKRESASTRYQITSERKDVFEVYAQPIYRDSNYIGTIFVHRNMTKEYEIDQMKSELISTVSHELRTPLTSVLGFTELMLSRELTIDRQKKYLTSIHTEAKRLTKLINNFLDLQRMESGDLEEEKSVLSTHNVIRQVLEQFEPNHPEHSFVLNDRATEDTIVGSEEKIQQLFINLVSNAVKFSPKGGMVEINMHSEDGRLLVHVRDEGLGIPEKDQDMLFKKFFRVDNSDRRSIGGTGLGLSICQKILSFHNGSINLASSNSSGSIFKITLPLHKQTTILPVKTEATANSGQLHVMLLEDDASLALLLMDELRNANFYVKHAMTTAEAIAYVHVHTVDAFVVDLMLSEDESGWDFIKQVKTMKHLKTKPIFISSALNEAKDRTSHYNVDKYLTKPYPPASLVKEMRMILNESAIEGPIIFPSEKDWE